MHIICFVLFFQWPFVRVLGAQEPASVVFSVLNGLAHLVMIGVFRSRVPKDAPLYWTVNMYALVSNLYNKY